MAVSWRPMVAPYHIVRKPSAKAAPRGAAETAGQSALLLGRHSLCANTGDDVAANIAKAEKQGALLRDGAAARPLGVSPLAEQRGRM